MTVTVRVMSLCVAAAALAACNPQDYTGVGGVYSFAIDENVTPLLMAEDTAFYFVESRIELPIQRPTQAEFQALGPNPPAPFPRWPWVQRDDLPFQVDWGITNLTEEPVVVTVTLNGVNEFHEYMPSFTVDDDDVVVGYSQWEKKLALEPFETRNGTIREEELNEVAVDLATVVNGAPNANEVVYFENQSDHDPRAKPYIPKIIPGLVGFRLGLQTNDTTRLVIEATVRARDLEGKLADPEEEPNDVWVLPVPMVFTPPELEE